VSQRVAAGIAGQTVDPESLVDHRPDTEILLGARKSIARQRGAHRGVGHLLERTDERVDVLERDDEAGLALDDLISRAARRSPAWQCGPIDRQRTTVGSHERIGVFRVFGRDAGYTALYTAYVTGVRCCIPEYKVDLKRLIELLINDKQNNPSNYSLVILSEGAEWQGYTVKEYGDADAFGHRKKMSVAEDLSDEIKTTTGEETVVSDLTYDLRSGSPDFVDRMVAFTFAGMAMDALQEGKSGLMTAINEGRYAMVAIPDPKLGPRKVDIESMYNTERYRPRYDRKLGLPIFLTRP